MVKDIGIMVAVTVVVLFILGMVKTGAEKKSLLDTVTGK